MRLACRLAADTLEMIGEHIQPGITTDEINTLVHEYTLAQCCSPPGLWRNPKWPPSPKSVCTSVNNVVCHGIPDGTVLKDGDIVNVDVTSIYPAKRGFTETPRPHFMGEPSRWPNMWLRLHESHWKLVFSRCPGGTIGDIGHAI